MTLSPTDAAYAAAWGVDEAVWESFVTLWADDVTSGEPLPTGSYYPVEDARWPLAVTHVTSRPSRLAVAAGELPHVRVQRDEPVELEWRTDAYDDLTAALSPSSFRHVAGVNPAASADVPLDGRWPADVRTRSIGMLTEASRRADVVVFPELSVDADLLPDLEAATETDCLVVAGSHITSDGLNVAPWWVGTYRGQHEKFAPARNEIHDWGLRPGPPRVRIWVAERWRVAIVICRDLLSPDVQHALVRAGVNLLLVPSWTPRIEAFEAAVAWHAVHAQAVSVVALGPYDDLPLGLLGLPIPQRTCYKIPGKRPGVWVQPLQ